jgi:hypothetical protein
MLRLVGCGGETILVQRMLFNAPVDLPIRVRLVVVAESKTLVASLVHAGLKAKLGCFRTPKQSNNARVNEAVSVLVFPNQDVGDHRPSLPINRVPSVGVSWARLVKSNQLRSIFTLP